MMTPFAFSTNIPTLPKMEHSGELALSTFEHGQSIAIDYGQ
jgi:hypothetical protein